MGGERVVEARGYCASGSWLGMAGADLADRADGGAGDGRDRAGSFGGSGGHGHRREVSDVPEVPSNAGEMCEHLRDALLEYDVSAGVLDDVQTGVAGLTGSGPGVAIEFGDGSRYIMTVHRVRPGREPDDPDAE